jgi:hypothetical protein
MALAGLGKHCFCGTCSSVHIALGRKFFDLYILLWREVVSGIEGSDIRTVGGICTVMDGARKAWAANRHVKWSPNPCGQDQLGPFAVLPVPTLKSHSQPAMPRNLRLRISP